MMRFATVRELSQKPSEFIQMKDPVIITKHGRPIRALVSMDGEELEDFILAQHFNLEQDLEEALRHSDKGKNISSSELRKKFQKNSR